MKAKMRATQEGDLLQVHLSQSAINDFLTCPDMSRFNYFVREQKQYYSDATAVGQALHAGLEELCKGNIDSPSELAAHCRLYFRHLHRTEGIEFKQKTLEQCLKYYDGWAKAVFASQPIMDIVTHPEVKVEVPFELRIGEWNGIELFFTGVMDAVTNIVSDWKTANSTYNEYEKAKWAIQPTMYALAAERLELTDNGKFQYVVFPKKYTKIEPQIFTVSRTVGQTNFLIEQGWRIAEYIKKEGTETPWLINDQHWLCSEKWCGNWQNCKGMFLKGDKYDRG